ncbi:hypothetical protein EWM64_g106 [Hericium alpestre]|uniref:Uncharacterized protein n=1 Tax=Hericium alpestre TaxID=135208 RepID=A0A4Z0AC38_9AGAM|nr:hypothetical protein EWM64_g106 [Hericium alpestre]
MSATTPSFKSLRLSQADYDRRASRVKHPEDALKSGRNTPKLKIVGENEEVKKVLRKSSGVAGQDWILVPYDSKADTVRKVMQRVEKIIRIPTKHWVLAGDGTVFRTHKRIASFDHFKQSQSPPIEVILLPTSDEDDWVPANRKPGKWKRFRLKAPPTSELPANPRARAQTLFPLMDTADSPHWAEYIVHRQAAEARVDETFEGLDYLEDAAYWKMMREVTLKSLNGEDDLTEEECKKIADAVSNVSLDVVDEGDEYIQDADVSTRIHSLVAPKSVDMHLTFNHRTGMNSVQCSYAIGFRINNKPLPPLENYPENRRVNCMHAGNGWKTFGWFYLDERRAEHSACPVSARDLKQVHDALFGPTTKGKLGERMSLRGTAKLMLASVGVAFDIALDEEDKNENGDGFRRNHDAHMELDAKKPGISAAHLRKICGIPPLEGDDPADLSIEQVVPLERWRRTYGSDGEYDSDDNEQYSDEDGHGHSSSSEEGREYVTIYRR